MISIVEATCEAALALKLKRVGLLGTRFTMEGQFYPVAFSERGITVVAPEPEDRTYIHEKYLGELVKGLHGEVHPEIGALAKAILGKMRKRLPRAVELVYDNYNALVIGFGPTERASDAIFSIAVYPRWVSLFFLTWSGALIRRSCSRGVARGFATSSSRMRRSWTSLPSRG